MHKLLLVFSYIDITVAFDSREYSGAEADGVISVTVVATETASIPYTVIIIPSESDPRSAREGIDYSNEPVEVIFNPGETEKTVDIIISPDCLREGSEFFNLSLSLPIGASNLEVFLGDPSEVAAEIEDTESKCVCLLYIICNFIHTILVVIYVNFTQALYSAEEQDGMLILILEADRVSVMPFSVVVIPIETGGPSKLNTVVTRTAQTNPFLNNTCTISDNYCSYTAVCIIW